MKKKLFASLCIFVFAIFALGACGNQETAEEQEPAQDEKQFKIGVTQFVEHPSLDAAFEGFKAALAENGFVEGENISYDFQSAQADPNNTATIATKFVADNVDLIFANATPSAQAALNATRDIPIVFTSVTDPVGAELVPEMNETNDGNVTGVSDFLAKSVDESVSFINEYFPGSTIGLIYNSGEQNSITQIEAVEKAADEQGIEVAKRSVSTSAEVKQAAEALIGVADVIYIVTDNTVVSALESVVGVCNDQNIPLIVGEPDSLSRGGFATFGIDYFTIGFRSGEMAASILSGDKKAGEIPVESPSGMQLFINKAAAEAQGIKWNTEWDSIAQFVEAE